jgi:hypothetical protein
VADARLVVHVVGAEHGNELAQEVGLLVVVLGRADPEHRIGTLILPELQQLLAYFVQRLIPGDFLPLTVHELHG